MSITNNAEQHADTISEKMKIKKTTNEVTFQNEKCAFSFDLLAKEISGSDLTDNYNLPRCYNKTSRSIKRALDNLTKTFNNDMSMYAVMDIIESAGVKMRSYCAMD